VGKVQIRFTKRIKEATGNLCHNRFTRNRKDTRRKPVAARRNDIVVTERVQIAVEMISPNRPRGRVSQLAQGYHLSRQALYDIAAKGEASLRQGLQPGQHGPQPQEQQVKVTKNRLQRSVLSLSANGVSQRGVRDCLIEILDTPVSLGWVNGALATLEARAEQINQSMTPTGGESLAGDEIFSNGLPNLLVVGNETLYIYALTRQDERDGETWGCLLLDVPEIAQFASDAGLGLAAGAKAAEIAQHQLDWDHLLRPLWGQATRLEKQAYAALAKVEERVALFDKSRSTKRLEQHLAHWEALVVTAEEQIEKLDTFSKIARAVDDCFALIDLETGQLTNPQQGTARLQALGLQMATLPGRIYQKLAGNLQNWAGGLFTYHQQLQQALVPLIEQYGSTAVAALCRIWQCEADANRRRLALPEKEKRHQIWQQALDEAFACLGDDLLWPVWEALSTLLAHPWRGSMLAECVNSLLRPVLDRRKHTDQGCLELFRFLHNVHPFLRGKRVGFSPAQLAGIALPDDPLSLLGLAPKVSS
jgi:hypothetical protein